MAFATRFAAVAATVTLASLVALGATPPTTVNYQGVLRNASDKPLTGTYDMTFRFFDAPSGGSEILVDTHAAAGTGAVAVSNGLFNTPLGGGTVTDGAGAGTYANLGEVFRDYGAVWVEITVGAETLSPRVKVQSSAYALNATNLGGRNASEFIDTSTTSQTKFGPLTIDATSPGQVGLAATGNIRGGWFKTMGSAAEAYIATNTGYGVYGYGPTAGGYFVNLYNGTNATLAASDYVIAGTGATGGALLVDSPGDQARLAVDENGVGFGIHAFGRNEGGHFSGNYGIQAYGSYMGGYVSNTAGNGYAQLGINGYGVLGYGSTSGGYFKDNVSGAYAYVGYNGFGIQGFGNPGFAQSASGGYFADGSAYAYVGDQNVVNYKIWGNGTVSFVQNHPQAPDKTVVYAAPEGDEAAVYTRGKARLTHGEARVALGETFQWVANPDVGLTASVTPRGACSGLYVVSVTPTELIVRESAGTSDVEFDWAVWGLRIGFERMPTVQPKRDFSPVPEASRAEDFYAKNPELKRFNALERFKAMESPGAGAREMTRAATLVAAINRFDPEVDGPIEAAKRPVPPGPETKAEAPSASARANGDVVASAAPAAPALPANTVPVEVDGTVSAGDVLALDPAGGAALRVSTDASDPRVVGIVAGDPGATWSLTAPVAVAGSIVLCRVDASAGPIEPGMLLVTSATPGHAMRAGATPAPGTIVGKALEPLASGQTVIRVLAMAR